MIDSLSAMSLREEPGEPSPNTWAIAIEVGAQHLYSLPAQEGLLVHRLSEVAQDGGVGPRRGRAVAVVAGRGGGGASVFAAALARCAGETLLVDLDSSGGGIDLLLGAEDSPGLRWPDLKVHDGRLTWAAVQQALPYRDGVRLLSCGRGFHEIDSASVNAVLEAGLRGGATVVCDVPRPTESRIRPCSGIGGSGRRHHQLRHSWHRRHRIPRRCCEPCTPTSDSWCAGRRRADCGQQKLRRRPDCHCSPRCGPSPDSTGSWRAAVGGCADGPRSPQRAARCSPRCRSGGRRMMSGSLIDRVRERLAAESGALRPAVVAAAI